jgi:hypothetical protein
VRVESCIFEFYFTVHSNYKRVITGKCDALPRLPGSPAQFVQVLTLLQCARAGLARRHFQKRRISNLAKRREKPARGERWRRQVSRSCQRVCVFARMWRGWSCYQTTEETETTTRFCSWHHCHLSPCHFALNHNGFDSTTCDAPNRQAMAQDELQVVVKLVLHEEARRRWHG